MLMGLMGRAINCAQTINTFSWVGLYKIIILAPLSKNFRIPDLIKLGGRQGLRQQTKQGCQRLATLAHLMCKEVAGSVACWGQ